MLSISIVLYSDHTLLQLLTCYMYAFKAGVHSSNLLLDKINSNCIIVCDVVLRVVLVL